MRQYIELSRKDVEEAVDLYVRTKKLLPLDEGDTVQLHSTTDAMGFVQFTASRQPAPKESVS